MTGAETLDVARDAIWTIVLVSSPLMVVGLVVGVVVSLFQALTQIQEQTLIFVPKILAIFVTLLLALPFMADSRSPCPTSPQWLQPDTQVAMRTAYDGALRAGECDAAAIAAACTVLVAKVPGIDPF